MRRAYGDQGLSVQTPGKLSRFEKPQLPFPWPNVASPSWPSLRPSVPMAQQSSEPTGPFCPSTKDAELAGGAGKRRAGERRP